MGVRADPGRAMQAGPTERHRLNRGGNRRLNRALYVIALTQTRREPRAIDYLERKRSEGKTRRGARRGHRRIIPGGPSSRAHRAWHCEGFGSSIPRRLRFLCLTRAVFRAFTILSAAPSRSCGRMAGASSVQFAVRANGRIVRSPDWV